MPKQRTEKRFCKDCGIILLAIELSRSGLCRMCGITRMIKASDMMRSLRRKLNAKTT